MSDLTLDPARICILTRLGSASVLRTRLGSGSGNKKSGPKPDLDPHQAILENHCFFFSLFKVKELSCSLIGRNCITAFLLVKT